MEKTSARKYKSYCRCTAVHTSDDSMIAPGTRRKLADQPRNKKPRAKTSSDIGAATLKANSSNSAAPLSRPDFSRSVMKPGVASRPSERDTTSQAITITINPAAPSSSCFQDGQYCAK